jgi:hypothetical protein
MKRVLAVLVAVLALSGCAGRTVTVSSSPSPIPNAKTYTNAKYRFSVTYDSEVFKAGGVEFDRVFNGDFTLKGRREALVWLFAISDRDLWLKQGKSQGPPDLRQALNGYVHQYSPDTTHGPVEPVVLDGVSGWKTHASGGGNTFDAYVVGTDRYVYVIAPAAETADWQALQPTLEAIVGSFRIMQ